MIISQQLKCCLHRYATYPREILLILSQQNTPQRRRRKAKLNETIMMFWVNMAILFF